MEHSIHDIEYYGYLFRFKATIAFVLFVSSLVFLFSPFLLFFELKLFFINHFILLLSPIPEGFGT